MVKGWSRDVRVREFHQKASTPQIGQGCEGRVDLERLRDRLSARAANPGVGNIQFSQRLRVDLEGLDERSKGLRVDYVVTQPADRWEYQADGPTSSDIIEGRSKRA
eukprot:6675689-Prymnesium_polylepis.3